MTVDVDLVMHADAADALGLVSELPQTAFDPLFPGVEEVVTTAFILPLRHRRTGIRVDLALGMSGFERNAIGRATRVAVGAGDVPVVTIEDLLVMKALAGRPQDDEDIRGIVALHNDSIDWKRCLGTGNPERNHTDHALGGGAKPRRIVFSVTVRGSVNWRR
jgi:hypothetical protein